MKKLAVIFLAVLYVVMSSGFTTYTHFCKGLRQGMSLSIKEKTDKPCSICSAKDKQLEKKKKGCCNHKSELAKVPDSLKKRFFQEFQFWGDAIPNRTLGAVYDIHADIDPTATSPLSTDVPIRGHQLYILHCTYRI